MGEYRKRRQCTINGIRSLISLYLSLDYNKNHQSSGIVSRRKKV